MTKEDTAPGLLSKMVKFVRNPTTNWSDLEQATADREDSVSKQLLKEMIERKRRNDFVRKREFDMLRKMRKREAMVGTGQDAAGRPSFFQSSMPSKPDDRASTIKKIDEIEAQMSMQWWKTKNNAGQDSSGRGQPSADSSNVRAGASTVPNGAAANSSGVDHSLPLSYLPTEPSRLESAAPSSPFRAAPGPHQRPAERTASVSPTVPAAQMPGSPAAAPDASAPLAFSSVNASMDFSASKFQAVEVGAVLTHDTELEEAAIRFANGDDEGAEAGLLEILGPGGLRHDHAESWLTLFDLYRASAQQDKFEGAAIQFVERFNRSAPQWFSMPDLVKQLGAPAVMPANSPAADWICPSIVGIQTVAALKAASLRAAAPCLDWSNLKTIEASAVEPLYGLFSRWVAEPLQLRFIGDAQLQKVLKNNTPSGERSTPQICWQLRMQALRITNRPDDFELVALDFCVTYEVSPPSWERARCNYQPVDPRGGTLGPEVSIRDVFVDAVSSTMMLASADSQMDSQISVMPQAGNLLGVELVGSIQGDAIAVLDKLADKLSGADIMVISCAKLIRVDFSAAGTLLNWVSARQAENRAVQFSDVNRLVAAFFNVIGISEHARVVVRVD